MYGLFAVPNDVKRYESYLVIWWTWVEQKREAGLRWQAAFLQVVTTVMTRAFERLFGATLLSRRAIVGSITLSMASMYLASGIGILILAWMGDRKAYDLFLSGASLVLGAVPLWLVLRGAVRTMVIFDTVLLSLLVVLVVAFFAVALGSWGFPGAAGVRVWEVMSRGRGHEWGDRCQRVLMVAYALRA